MRISSTTTRQGIIHTPSRRLKLRLRWLAITRLHVVIPIRQIQQRQDGCVVVWRGAVSMGSRAFIILLISILVTGCQREAEVTISQNGSKIVFTSTRGSNPGCSDEVKVYKSEDQLNPIWTLSAPDHVPCRSQFVYGETVPGFIASGVAPKLQAGQVFTVTMNGPGLVGGGQFTKAR